jgi:acyl carrier protein
VKEAAVLAHVLQAASAVFDRPVHAEDDFFGLGGDSLSAIELITRLEESLGFSVDDDIVFSADSFATMAAELASAGPEQSAAEPVRGRDG